MNAITPLCHYFGDVDTFIDDLLRMHRAKAEEYTEKFKQATNFDPDFYSMSLAPKEIIFFHMQLARVRQEERYQTVYRELNALVDPQIVRLFAPYVGLNDQHELAARFFDQARDMFYSRITEENMNEPFLRNLIDDVRALIKDLMHQPGHGS